MAPVPAAAPRPTLYVLDAYALIFQVFHAIPAMSGPAGQPTNAVFGLFRDLLNLIRTRKPDYLVGAFDGGGPVFRSTLDPNYKATRSAMPVDLVPQIEVIKRLFAGFGVPALMVPGFEADDLIATLARQAEASGHDVFLCTSDKDARQLLTPHIKILNLRKDVIMGPDGLRDDWGIGPEQVVDLLALTGDTVDNVPGVPGIGVKTAAELLRKFGDLDTLLARIPEVSGKKRQENLTAHADTARKARELVRLRDDVPLGIEWDDLKLSPPNFDLLKDLCVECGFHRFLDELGAMRPPTETGWDTSGYVLVDTPEAFDAFLDDLKRQPRYALDTETTSTDPLRADLVGLSFAWALGIAYYLPVRGPEGERVLDEAATLQALKPVLEDPATEKIGQNLKYDLLVLARHGIELAGPITDTMVLSYLLESGERNHNLDELSRRLLEHTMIPITSLIGKGKAQITMDVVPVAKVAEYAAEDADAAWRIAELLVPKVREEGLWALYETIERPLLCVLANMERTGIAIDAARLRALSKEYASRLETIRDRVHAEAGHPFAINSGPQLRKVLFEELGLPVVRRTPKGEPSTDAEVLEELAPRHPLPRLIVQHRQLEKLKGTYLDTLPDLAHADGRIHASFNQVVAATGRLSSSDPNLQNIPVRTEDGREVRRAFVPGERGWQLLAADYSQIELRILAHYSGDDTLSRAFREGKDIHAVVASQIFAVPEADVTAEQRRMAKTVNFGIMYGLSGFGLAARLGISRGEGDTFIEAYLAQYPGVTEFISRTLRTAKDTGRVETILGRRRLVNGVKNTDRMRSQPERIAVNAVIQGSAADLIKKAMIDLDRELRARKSRARLLLQIHDELVLEAPEAEIAELAALVDRVMTSAIAFDVPIEVDVAAGPNWLDVAAIGAPEEPFRLNG
jgi:DNA polymerase-1